MFKFVDKKSFFKFCNIVSIAALIFLLVEKKNDFVTVVVSILSILVLLQVSLFYNYNRKKILKAMISILLIFLLFEEIFAINGFLFKYKETLVMPYYWGVHIVNFILLLLMFNNHCVVDYTDINKVKALRFNVTVTMIYMIIAIAEIVGLIVFAMPDFSIIKPGFADVLVSSIYRITVVFVIVCCEAKINGLVKALPAKNENKKTSVKSDKKTKVKSNKKVKKSK